MQRNPPPQISPQTQKELADFQLLSQKLDQLYRQKQLYTETLREKDLSIKELENLGDDSTVYRQYGGILIKKPRSVVLEDLKDEKLTLEMRIKSLERNEPSMKSNYEEMKQKLQKKLTFEQQM